MQKKDKEFDNYFCYLVEHNSISKDAEPINNIIHSVKDKVWLNI